jgi:hypothetical protein
MGRLRGQILKSLRASRIAHTVASKIMVLGGSATLSQSFGPIKPCLVRSPRKPPFFLVYYAKTILPLEIITSPPRVNAYQNVLKEEAYPKEMDLLDE